MNFIKILLSSDQLEMLIVEKLTYLGLGQKTSNYKHYRLVKAILPLSEDNHFSHGLHAMANCRGDWHDWLLGLIKVI